VIREGGWRIRIGIRRVAVMFATSFCVGVRFSFLSDLKGVLVAVSTTAVVTAASVRGRIGRRRRERRRRCRHEKRFGSEGLVRIGEICNTKTSFFYNKSSAWINPFFLFFLSNLSSLINWFFLLFFCFKPNTQLQRLIPRVL
jgi:hypothetical protein